MRLRVRVSVCSWQCRCRRRHLKLGFRNNEASIGDRVSAGREGAVAFSPGDGGGMGTPGFAHQLDLLALFDYLMNRAGRKLCGN